MIKITQKLLVRYHQGSCSFEERKAVEQWLELDDDQAENPFTEEKTEVLKKEVWQGIESKIDTKRISTRRLLLRPWHYGAAACIVLMLSILGLQKVPDHNFILNERQQTIADKENAKETKTDFFLINSSVHDHQKLTDTDCAISFKGRINIYNGFSKEMEIVCNGKALKLLPNQYYNMFSINGKEIQGFSLGKKNSGPTINDASTFKVCT